MFSDNHGDAKSYLISIINHIDITVDFMIEATYYQYQGFKAIQSRRKLFWDLFQSNLDNKFKSIVEKITQN